MLTAEDQQALKKAGYLAGSLFRKSKISLLYHAKNKESTPLDGSLLIKLILPYNDIDSLSGRMYCSKHPDLNCEEFEYARKLCHPHIQQVVDLVDLPDSGQALIKRMVPGTSLHDLVDALGPLDVRQAYGIFASAWSALHAFTSKDLIHGDINPENIVLSSGEAHLIDLQTVRSRPPLAPGGFSYFGTKMTDKESEYFPSKGVSPFTHPSIVNAYILGRSAAVASRVDEFGLASSFLYAVTGERLFSCKLQEDDEGVFFDTGERSFRVSVFCPETMQTYTEPLPADEIHCRRDYLLEGITAPRLLKEDLHALLQVSEENEFYEPRIHANRRFVEGSHYHRSCLTLRERLTGFPVQSRAGR